jgi:hypothetical protein
VKGRSAAPESHQTTVTAGTLELRDQLLARPDDGREHQPRVGAERDRLPARGSTNEQGAVGPRVASYGCAELVERRLAHGSASYAPGLRRRCRRQPHPLARVVPGRSSSPCRRLTCHSDVTIRTRDGMVPTPGQYLLAGANVRARSGRRPGDLRPGTGETLNPREHPGAADRGGMWCPGRSPSS